MISLLNKISVVIALMAATAQVQSGPVVIDGRLTAPDEYDEVFNSILGIKNTTLDTDHLFPVLPGGGVYEETLHLRRMNPGGPDLSDLFIMFMLPAEIQDITYGANLYEGYVAPVRDK